MAAVEMKVLLESHVWILVQRKETDAFKEEACAIEWKTKTKLGLMAEWNQKLCYGQRLH
jgi:hypothetical protein